MIPGVLQGAGVAGTGDSTCRQTGDSRENTVCIPFPWHLSLLGAGMSDQNVSQPQELEFVRLREWLCLCPAQTQFGFVPSQPQFPGFVFPPCPGLVLGEGQSLPELMSCA